MLTADISRTKILFLSLWTGVLCLTYCQALVAIEGVS